MDTEGDPPIGCQQKRAIFEQTAILAGGAQKERMRVHPLLRCCVLSALARMDLVDAAGAVVSRAWLPSSVTAGGQDKIDPDSMEPNLAIAVRFVHARSDRHGQCRSGWRQGCGAGAASSVPPASRVKSISPRSMSARSTRTRTRSPSRSTWREPVATSWLRLRSHS